mmetsp:Transcript_8702/g.16492  ORF Transcript_8702/g.16492 Transcript_8702/m.16492 type:complete len:146 (-) Transcript_8702:89-526(-)
MEGDVATASAAAGTVLCTRASVSAHTDEELAAALACLPEADRLNLHDVISTAGEPCLEEKDVDENEHLMQEQHLTKKADGCFFACLLCGAETSATDSQCFLGEPLFCCNCACAEAQTDDFWERVQGAADLEEARAIVIEERSKRR